MNKNYKEMLENLKGESNLKDRVVDIVLNHYDDYENIEDYFFEVLQSGCQSGIVLELIYYKDTTEFFITYQEEIFDLFNEIIENYNYISFELNANNLAWFGFEETLRNIAYELEIEM